MSRRPSVRRSSTTRSIGTRSDFNSTVAGDATPGASSTLDDEDSRPSSRRGSTNGAADDHLDHYVESQLQRVRSSASLGAFEDELETQAEIEKGNGNGDNGHA